MTKTEVIALLLCMILPQLRTCTAINQRSFTQLKNGFKGNDVQVYAGNPIACAGRCADHNNCGAFKWDDTTMPKCFIFTNIYEQKDNPGIFYGGTILSNGDGLWRTPAKKNVDDLFYLEAAKCAGMGHKLILIPTTPRDVTIVASHGQFTFNARRDGPAGQVVTRSGDAVDTSLIRRPISEITASASFTDQCFPGNSFNLWAARCPDWYTGTSVTICQYTL